MVDEKASQTQNTLSSSKGRQAARRHSEQFYRDLVENLSDLVCRWLPDTTLIFTNRAYADFFESTPEKLQGVKWLEFIPEDQRGGVQELIKKMMESGKHQEMVHQVSTEGGGQSWQQWQDVPMVDDMGNVIEFQSIGKDITVQKRGEKQYREQKELVDTLIDVIPERLLIIEKDGTVLRANDFLARNLGLDSHEIVGKNIYTLIPPELAAQRKALIDQSIEEFRPIRFLDSRAGIILENRVYPVLHESGNKKHAVVLAIDMTEQHFTMEQLKRQAETFLYISRLSPEAIWQVDQHGKLTEVNDAACNMLGFTFEEMVGRHLSEFDVTQTEEEVRANISVLLEKGRHLFKSKHMRKDGGIIDVEVTAYCWLENDNFRLIGFVRDIEKEQLTKKIERYGKLLQITNGVKKTLLDNARHEIMTPMNAIIGFSKSLLDADDISDHRQVQLNTVYENAVSLYNLLSNVLLNVQGEISSFSTKTEEFDFPSCCRKIMEEYRDWFESHSLCLTANLHKDLPKKIIGDENITKQILELFVQNVFELAVAGEVTFNVWSARISGDEGRLEKKHYDKIQIDALYEGQIWNYGHTEFLDTIESETSDDVLVQLANNVDYKLLLFSLLLKIVDGIVEVKKEDNQCRFSIALFFMDTDDDRYSEVRRHASESSVAGVSVSDEKEYTGGANAVRDLPGELLAELRVFVEEGDMTRFLQLLDRVEYHSKELAAELRHLAYEYRYDKLKNYLGF